MIVAPKFHRADPREQVLAHCFQVILVGNAGSVVVAGEPHEAADRQPAKSPLHAGLVRMAKPRLAESDGELVDLGSHGLAHQEVAKLMHGDHDAEHQEDRYERAQEVDEDAGHELTQPPAYA